MPGRTDSGMSREAAEFVIYIINEVADRYGLYPSHVYRELNNSGCIQRYLVPFYDVLHTMSSESIAEDAINYARLRGAAI